VGWLSASTVACQVRLPVIEGGDFLLQLAQFVVVFDCTTELHAALVFLLPTGFDAALLFVVPGHFESPWVGKRPSRWTPGVTVWRRTNDRTMKSPRAT